MPGDQVGAAYAKISLDSKELDSGMASSHSKFSSFANGLESRAGSAGKAIGTALAAGVVASGVALAGAATVGLSAFKDLESSASDAASKAVTVNGKSAEQIKAQYDSIKDHVMSISRELGAATVFDPTQVSDAFGAIAAAGKDVAKMTKDDLRPMLDLAASDMKYGLGPSTQLVMSAMAQFGLSMKDTGKIADIFAKGAAGSGAGLGDFAEALKYVGPVAASTGISLEETTAMIGKLRDAGIDASTAGTTLRSSFLQLANPTKPIVSALEKLGLTYEQVDPRTHTFIETLELLKSKGANAFDLEAIFGKESVSGVTTLMGLTEETRQFTKELENSAGVARTMADLKLDSLEMDLEAAKGAASDLAIGLGEQLAPAARSILQGFSAIAPKIAEFTKAIFAGDWGKVGDLISNGVKSGWDKLKDLGKDLYNKIKGVNWSGLGSYVTKGIKAAWNELSGLGGQLLGWLKGIDWGSVGSSVAAGFVGLGTWIYDAITGVDFSGIASTIIGYMGAAKDYMVSLGTTLYDAIVGVDWGSIGGKVLASLSSVGTRISEILSGINFGDVANTLKTAFNDAVDNLSAIGEKISALFAKIDFNGIKTSLVNAFNSAVESLSNIGGQIFDYLDKVEWSDIGVSIADGVKTCIKGLGNVAEDIGNLFEKHSWDSVGSGIGEKISAGIGKIKDYASKIVSGIRESLPKLEAFGEEAGGKIRDAFGKIKDYASKIVTGLYDGLKAWVVSGKDLENVGRLIIDGIAAGIAGIAWVGSKVAESMIWLFSWENIKGALDFVALGLLAIGDIATGMMQEAGVIGLKIGGAIAGGIADAMDAVNFDVAGININLGEYTSGLRGIEQMASERKLAAETLSGVNVVSKEPAAKKTSTISGAGAKTQTIDDKGNILENGIPTGNNIFNAEPSSGSTTKSGLGPAYSIGAGGSISTKSGQASVSKVTYGGKTYTPTEFAKALASEGYNSNEIYAVLQDIKANTKRAEGGQSWGYSASAVEEAIQPILDANKKAAEQNKVSANEVNSIYKAGATNVIGLNLNAATKNIQSEKVAIEKNAEITKASANAWKLATGQAEQLWKNAVSGAASVTTQAAKTVESILVGSSQTAANAIRIGSEVAANFTTQGAQAVKIGLDASGREIAVIGQVAQARFTQAGGELYSKVQVAGSDFQSKTGAAGTDLQSKLSTGANSIGNAANMVGQAASKLLGFDAGALWKSTMGTLSGSGSTTKTASPTGKTAAPTTTGGFSDPWMNAGKGVNPSGYAAGTETSGPELALIGEAGKEFVIPTKTKRWDLLLAAMRSYGIRGMAEGGSAGAGGSEAVDADKMQAYFGITGLASMSKQVKKIISDLKDFFRISWSIIKAEGSTYWRQINQIITNEVTLTRDGAWQAALDIRNTWISANAAILTDAKASWAGMWPSMEPGITGLKQSLISAFQEANSGVKSAIDSMVLNGESSLQAFAANWSSVWSQMLTDLSNAQSQISSAITSIAAELAKINVNVSISGGGGSGGGGGGAGGSGGGVTDGVFGGWLDPTGDWSDLGGGGGANNVVVNTNGGPCAVGTNCKSGCPDFQTEVNASIMPGDDRYAALHPTASGGGGGMAAANPGYTLPAIFRARGGLVNKPELDVIADQGPEIILPAKLTRMFTSLADAGLGQVSGGSSKNLIIEDHTVHHWYMDGKEVTNQVMKGTARQLRLKGAIATR